MTMQVGVGESASRPISRFRHGFAACVRVAASETTAQFIRQQQASWRSLAQEIDLRPE
jgi:hypothetical protein